MRVSRLSQPAIAFRTAWAISLPVTSPWPLMKSTAFEIEELAGLERIIADPTVKELAFDYLAGFHLLRAVPAEAAEFVVLVAEGGGRVADNCRGKRVGNAYGFVVLRVGHEDRTLDALSDRRHCGKSPSCFSRTRYVKRPFGEDSCS